MEKQDVSSILNGDEKELDIKAGLNEKNIGAVLQVLKDEDSSKEKMVATTSVKTSFKNLIGTKLKLIGKKKKYPKVEGNKNSAKKDNTFTNDIVERTNVKTPKKLLSINQNGHLDKIDVRKPLAMLELKPSYNDTFMNPSFNVASVNQYHCNDRYANVGDHKIYVNQSKTTANQPYSNKNDANTYFNVVNLTNDEAQFNNNIYVHNVNEKLSEAKLDKIEGLNTDVGEMYHKFNTSIENNIDFQINENSLLRAVHENYNLPKDFELTSTALSKIVEPKIGDVSVKNIISALKVNQDDGEKNVFGKQNHSDDEGIGGSGSTFTGNKSKPLKEKFILTGEACSKLLISNEEFKNTSHSSSNEPNVEVDFDCASLLQEVPYSKVCWGQVDSQLHSVETGQHNDKNKQVFKNSQKENFPLRQSKHLPQDPTIQNMYVPPHEQMSINYLEMLSSQSNFNHDPNTNQLNDVGITKSHKINRYQQQNDMEDLADQKDGKCPPFIAESMGFCDGEIHWNSMIQSEVCNTPRKYYFSYQRYINGKARAVLVEWLSEVCEAYELKCETYYKAVDYVDRYLGVARNTKCNQLQLLGITSLYIASKLEEIYPPKLKKFSVVTDGASNIDQIIQQEYVIVKTFDWQMNNMTSYNWLCVFLLSQIKCHRLISEYENFYIGQWSLGHLISNENVFELPNVAFTTMKLITQLLEVVILDPESLKFSNMVMAASIFFIYNLYDINILVFTGLQLKRLEDCVRWMSIFSELVRPNLLSQLKFSNSFDCLNYNNHKEYNIQEHRDALKYLRSAKQKVMQNHLPICNPNS